MFLFLRPFLIKKVTSESIKYLLFNQVLTIFQILFRKVHFYFDAKIYFITLTLCRF